MSRFNNKIYQYSLINIIDIIYISTDTHIYRWEKT